MCKNRTARNSSSGAVVKTLQILESHHYRPQRPPGPCVFCFSFLFWLIVVPKTRNLIIDVLRSRAISGLLWRS